MTEVLKASVGDDWYSFQTRVEAGYDSTVTDKIVIKEIFVENVYDVNEGHLVDTGIVIDVGANIGAFSIYAAALGAKAVYAFEPNSITWGMLKENIKLNDFEKIIYPMRVGVLDGAGKRKLLGDQGAAFIEGVKNITDPEILEYLEDLDYEIIQTISLASIFADNKLTHCDILKMDCEGSEYDIIEAVDSETLAKVRYLTMEFHITDAVTFGKMIAKLTLTHNIHIIGKYNNGGQIYAQRY